MCGEGIEEAHSAANNHKEHHEWLIGEDSSHVLEIFTERLPLLLPGQLSTQAGEEEEEGGGARGSLEIPGRSGRLRAADKEDTAEEGEAGWA